MASFMLQFRVKKNSRWEYVEGDGQVRCHRCRVYWSSLHESRVIMLAYLAIFISSEPLDSSKHRWVTYSTLTIVFQFSETTFPYSRIITILHLTNPKPYTNQTNPRNATPHPLPRPLHRIPPPLPDHRFLNPLIYSCPTSNDLRSPG